MSFRTVYGYSWSENGWRMVNRDGCVVAGPSIGLPHSNTAPVRRGDAATILNAWLWWYHHNVEPLTSPVWGWSATNLVPNSNHLAGTALDINAPKYPWGYYRMPATLRTKVERGLALFEGTIFWGRRWSKPDEMHYQLGFREGDPRISAFAAKLNNGHLGVYKPTPPPPPPPNLIDEEAEVAAVWLGDRLHEGELPCKDDAGRYADFTNGSIYWKRGTDRAYAIPKGGLYEAFSARKWELEELGFPTARHAVVDGGGVQMFEGGQLLVQDGGRVQGYLVHGEIWKRYAAMGFEQGPLGWPVSEEHAVEGTDNIRQDFENGSLVWSPTGVAVLSSDGKDLA